MGGAGTNQGGGSTGRRQGALTPAGKGSGRQGERQASSVIGAPRGGGKRSFLMASASKLVSEDLEVGLLNSLPLLLLLGKHNCSK